MKRSQIPNKFSIFKSLWGKKGIYSRQMEEKFKDILTHQHYSNIYSIHYPNIFYM